MTTPTTKPAAETRARDLARAYNAAQPLAASNRVTRVWAEVAKTWQGYEVCLRQTWIGGTVGEVVVRDDGEREPTLDTLRASERIRFDRLDPAEAPVHQDR